MFSFKVFLNLLPHREKHQPSSQSQHHHHHHSHLRCCRASSCRSAPRLPEEIQEERLLSAAPVCSGFSPRLTPGCHAPACGSRVLKCACRVPKIWLLSPKMWLLKYNITLQRVASRAKIWLSCPNMRHVATISKHATTIFPTRSQGIPACDEYVLPFANGDHIQTCGFHPPTCD